LKLVNENLVCHEFKKHRLINNFNIDIMID